MSSLDEWVASGWAKRHETSVQEVQGIFDVAHRDINDCKNAAGIVSLDTQLSLLYNAARALADVALRVKGYRIGAGKGQHEKTIESLRYTLGEEWRQTSRFLDQVRRQRTIADYDAAGTATAGDVKALMDEIERLEPAVHALVRKSGYVIHGPPEQE